MVNRATICGRTILPISFLPCKSCLLEIDASKYSVVYYFIILPPTFLLFNRFASVVANASNDHCILFGHFHILLYFQRWLITFKYANF